MAWPRFSLLWLALVAAVVTAPAQGTPFFDPEGSVIAVQSEDHFETLLQTQAPLFVDFYTTWCGYCQILKPIWEELARELAADPAPAVRIAAIDCTVHRGLQAKYKVRGFPTLILFLGGDRLVRYERRPRSLVHFRQFLTEHQLLPTPPPPPPPTPDQAAQASQNVHASPVAQALQAAQASQATQTSQQAAPLPQRPPMSPFGAPVAAAGAADPPNLGVRRGDTGRASVSVDAILRSPRSGRGAAEVLRLVLEDFGLSYQDIRLESTDPESVDSLARLHRDSFGLPARPGTSGDLPISLSLRSDLLRTGHARQPSEGLPPASNAVTRLQLNHLVDDLSLLLAAPEQPNGIGAYRDRFEDPHAPNAGLWTDLLGAQAALLRLGQLLGLVPGETQQQQQQPRAVQQGQVHEELMGDFRFLLQLCADVRSRITVAADLATRMAAAASSDSTAVSRDSHFQESLRELLLLQPPPGGAASDAGLLFSQPLALHADLELLEAWLAGDFGHSRFRAGSAAKARLERRPGHHSVSPHQTFLLGGGRGEGDSGNGSGSGLLTVADYLVFDLLDFVASVDNRYLAWNFPRLHAWYGWFAQRPALYSYRHSGRRPAELW